MGIFDSGIIEGNNLINLIPQRPPMVMISKLLSVDEKTCISSLMISEDNIFCNDSIFCESGLIENIAQTAAARFGYLAIHANENEGEVKIGFIGGIKNLLIHDLPNSGTEINTQITIEHEVMGASIISAKVYTDDKVFAEGELKIFLKND